MKRLLYFLREGNYVTVRKNDVNKAFMLLYEKYSSLIFLSYFTPHHLFQWVKYSSNQKIIWSSDWRLYFINHRKLLYSFPVRIMNFNLWWTLYQDRYCVSWSSTLHSQLSSKQKTLNQCWVNVGPASSMSSVHWDISSRSTPYSPLHSRALP